MGFLDKVVLFVVVAVATDVVLNGGGLTESLLSGVSDALEQWLIGVLSP